MTTSSKAPKLIGRNPEPVRSSGLEKVLAMKAHGAKVLDHTVNKPWRDPALGYESVELIADDGTRQIHPVEELVYVTFIGPLVDGMRVCHLDGNPANNAASNLAQMTPERPLMTSRSDKRTSSGDGVARRLPREQKKRKTELLS